MMRAVWGMVFLLAPASTAAQQPGEAARLAAYAARVDSLVAFYADAVSTEDYAQGHFFHVAARLARGDADARAWAAARVDSLVADPQGDVFWMYPAVLAMYLGQDRLPAATLARLRDRWRTYTPYRGDTENHFVLYYTALYLAAQRYPGEAGDRWFTGKSSEENRAEAHDFLLHWIALTTTQGQGEYDSPRYLSFFVAPMAMLHAFADDPTMRRRAGLMLDYLLADYFAETLGGVHVGASSRIYPDQLFARWTDAASGYAWLLFGNVPFHPHAGALVLALSGYRPPRVLHALATDRSAPYVHRERKRTRHRIRHSAVRNAPVYKYTYVRPEYALGSTQGGLLQPVQQHTWELQWADPARRGPNVLFTTHPYASPYEGTMYFAEPWHLVTELIARSKTEYDTPHKWTGGSPHEQVVQHEDALVVLYDLPEGVRFPHIQGFFSRELVGLRADSSGWIFARGGDAYVAYYPLAPYTWEAAPDGSRRLVSTALHNGAVIQAAPASAFADLEAFAGAVRALPLQAEREPAPAVRFTTLGGTAIEAVYGEAPRVGGVPVDYAGWPLYDGPFLRGTPGRLELRHGPLRRVLDLR